MRCFNPCVQVLFAVGAMSLCPAQAAVFYQASGAAHWSVRAPLSSGTVVDATISGAVAFDFTGAGASTRIAAAASNLATPSGTRDDIFLGADTYTDLTGSAVALSGDTSVFGIDPASGGEAYDFFYGTGLKLSAAYVAYPYFSTEYLGFVPPMTLVAHGFALTSGGEAELRAGTASFSVDFRWAGQGILINQEPTGSVHLDFVPLPEPTPLIAVLLSGAMLRTVSR